jgi:hypothetical protein
LPMNAEAAVMLRAIASENFVWKEALCSEALNKILLE